MIRLSAFADEIAADLNQQIAVLQEEHIQHIELRSVWGVNVLDLDDQQVAEIQQTLQAHGIRVAAIASPIGKVPVDASFEGHLQRFKRAVVLAQRFQARHVRLFSFYPPTSSAADNHPASYRDEVLIETRGQRPATSCVSQSTISRRFCSRICSYPACVKLHLLAFSTLVQLGKPRLILAMQCWNIPMILSMPTVRVNSHL